MIAFNSNGKDVLDAIKADLKGKASPQETDKLLRIIASTLTGMMRDRVHVQGKDSNDNQIGTYSSEYMKVRTGNFKSSKIVRGVNKGNARKKYNRTSDTKVILSLTRQMENDMSICERNPIKIPYGYAIGYQNDFNFEKLTWLEKKYKKQILTKLSKHEEEVKDEIVNNYLNDRTTN
jgi:hypothetical protein